MVHISRRSVVAAIPLLGIAGRAACRTSMPDFASIERRSGGKLGLFVIDTGTERTLAWRGEKRFPFCSSAKMPLAAFVLWKVDRGQLRLDQPVRYGEADLLPYAPVTRAAVAGGALPISELCRAAIAYSDNAAANLLWRETGGPQALTSWMRSQGDPEFDLSSVEPDLNLSRYGEVANTTTPKAMGESCRRFVLGNVLRPESRERLAGWLVANTTGDKRLRAGLPPSWQVGDKTGTFKEKWFSTVDLGVVWPTGGSPLVIAGLLTDTPDTATAEKALVEVARQVMVWRA